MSNLRLTGRKAREIARLTGVSLWRGFVGFYRSDNLTYAASIAYYALLSMFPFAMLGLAVLGSVTSDDRARSEVLNFVLRYFPASSCSSPGSSTHSGRTRSLSGSPAQSR